MHVVHVYLQSIALEYATTKSDRQRAMKFQKYLFFLDPWSDKYGKIV